MKRVALVRQPMRTSDRLHLIGIQLLITGSSGPPARHPQFLNPVESIRPHIM